MLAQGSAIIRNKQNYEIKINVSAELGDEATAWMQEVEQRRSSCRELQGGISRFFPFGCCGHRRNETGNNHHI